MTDIEVEKHGTTILTLKGRKVMLICIGVGYCYTSLDVDKTHCSIPAFGQYRYVISIA